MLRELLGFLAGIIGYIVAAGSSVVGSGVSRRESYKLYWMDVNPEEH